MSMKNVEGYFQIGIDDLEWEPDSNQLRLLPEKWKKYGIPSPPRKVKIIGNLMSVHYDFSSHSYSVLLMKDYYLYVPRPGQLSALKEEWKARNIQKIRFILEVDRNE